MRQQSTHGKKKSSSASRSSSRTETILDKLKADHKKIKELCKKVLGEDSMSTDTAQSSFEELKGLVLSHAKAEEATLYTNLKLRTQEDDNEKLLDSVMEAFEEHHVAEMLISELSELNPSDERWKAKMTVLSEALEHHIEEEESTMFKGAKKEIPMQELAQIGEQFNEEKEILLSKN